MINVKATPLYSEVIKELNYPFGNIFIFKGFVVAEINRGVNYTWDNHARLVTEDISCFLGTNGDDLIYISNRVYPYSVVPSDWPKFYNSKFDLKEYCIVSDSKLGKLCVLVENLFLRIKIKHFNNLYNAVNFVKKGMNEVA
ncbi:hypothetical protein [Thalassobellus citreus]|uniref:hypothetical protein n=1 Tax=Thalassobellus citreus TaxID=3367752 RepID=UPI0037AA4D2A